MAEEKTTATGERCWKIVAWTMRARDGAYRSSCGRFTILQPSVGSGWQLVDHIRPLDGDCNASTYLTTTLRAAKRAAQDIVRREERSGHLPTMMAERARTVRKVLQLAEEDCALRGVAARPEMIERGMAYGAYFKVTAAELETMLDLSPMRYLAWAASLPRTKDNNRD